VKACPVAIDIVNDAIERLRHDSGGAVGGVEGGTLPPQASSYQ